jgi:organic hydroperoxide reductase OsmC/OhrA
MALMNVSLRNVPGTRAAMGWADGHTVVIDRAEGKAGGMGLGFNGGQMLALAIGGCFCNDLRYAADAMGIELDAIEVDVAIELDGEPLLVTSATMTVRVSAGDSVDTAEVIHRAEADSAVSNSVRAGFPVAIVAA